MPPPILVLGARGQLAQELLLLARARRRALVVLGRETLDLATLADPGALLDRERPAAVINAAAFSGVDLAERQPVDAFRLNRDMPGTMARACAARDLPFVHVSSDYVFDGAKGEPYVEADSRAPLNVYGRSKAEGEDAVEAAGGRWTTLRTSWVFGQFGTNFLKTMIRLADAGETVRVVDDQRGRPTWSHDCAVGALAAADAHMAGRPEANGLFHLAGADDATWADVAEEVFRLRLGSGGPSRLTRITTADYPTPARRPADSRLDSRKLQRVFNLPARPWRESVACTLAALEQPT